MKYRVHIYAVVRVPVSNVEADTPQEACFKAMNVVSLGPLLSRTQCCGRADYVEYADEVQEFLVDVEGDEDFSNSQTYTWGDLDTFAEIEE